MQAVRIHRFGGPEVMAIEEIDRPTPAADEVVIKVFAASVNPVDAKARPADAMPPSPSLVQRRDERRRQAGYRLCGPCNHQLFLFSRILRLLQQTGEACSVSRKHRYHCLNGFGRLFQIDKIR